MVCQCPASPAATPSTLRAFKAFFGSFNKHFSNSARICSLVISPRRSRILPRYKILVCRTRPRHCRATAPSRKRSASWRRIYNPATFRPHNRTSPRFNRTFKVSPRRYRPRPPMGIIITAEEVDRVRSVNSSISSAPRCNRAISLPRNRHTVRWCSNSSNLLRAAERKRRRLRHQVLAGFQSARRAVDS